MPFGLRLEYTFRKWTAIAKRIKDIPNVLRQGYIQFLRRRNELIARKREFGLSLLESMLKDIPNQGRIPFLLLAISFPLFLGNHVS